MRSFLLFLSFLPFLLSAQKWDNNIMVGYDGGGPNGGLFGGTMISFADTGLVLSRYDFDFVYIGSAYISDAQGQLLMYSNGCSINNADHQRMANGGQISFGAPTYGWCSNNHGTPTKAHIMLPAPGENDLYYYLYHALTDAGYDKAVGFYAKVDAMADNGKGAVIEKNLQYTEPQDTIYSHLDACRHANGRDWWIINGTFDGEGFTKHLITPDGIKSKGRQNVGPAWKQPIYGGQSDISPDGTRYARQNPYNGTDLYYFDRCSGNLTYDKHIAFPTDTSWFTGLCFSPSGRFAYISTAWNVWQMDITVADPMTTLIKVAEFDGFIDFFASSFYYLELGPDGKIYIQTSNGTRYMHTIHQPDMPGLACDLRQHDIALHTYSRQILMNTPNFRLFDHHGSPCDTLGINGYVATEEPTEPLGKLYMYPNPITSGDICHIHSDQKIAEINLLSTDGRFIQKMPALDALDYRFVISENLPSGIYQLVVRLSTGQTKTQKLVVMH